MSNEITMKSENALAEVPVSIADMEADAELGGKVTLADIGIPFISILQGLSPQVNPDSPKYIKGATPGMILITVLNKVIDGREEGLWIVPCYYERKLVEWVLREQGGGLVGSYDISDPIKDQVQMKQVGDKQMPLLPNGHMLVDTAYWYDLFKIGNTWKQGVMSYKSTFLAASRAWNSTLQTTMIPGTEKIAPRWLYEWKLNSQKEEKKGFTFSGPKHTMGKMVSKPLYDMAKDYAKIAASGVLTRKVLAGDAADQPEGSRTSRMADEDVPF